MTIAMGEKGVSDSVMAGTHARSAAAWVPSHFVHGGHREAVARLEQEHRASNTTASTAGGGFIPLGPPAFIGVEFANAARSYGVLPQVMRVEPLADTGMVVKQAKITTGAPLVRQVVNLRG